MSQSVPILLVERREQIAIVTLNRPDKRNALSEALWAELKKTFENFDRDVRCVVLAGAGKHFCAGLDLSEHRHREPFDSIFMSRFAHATLDAIQFGGRPVVTAMQGAVIGGGLEVATATHCASLTKPRSINCPKAAADSMSAAAPAYVWPRSLAPVAWSK
jgi:(methylthio)acryloyl-CoA hydratase